MYYSEFCPIPPAHRASCGVRLLDRAVFRFLVRRGFRKSYTAYERSHFLERRFGTVVMVRQK
jgi:hypothetical protein